MMTVQQAKEIAEHQLQMHISSSEILSQYRFSEAGLKSENERFWTFVRGSDELFEEGYVPGAVYACVDKQDGRVWTDDEVEQYYSDVEAKYSRKPARAA
jgi:hypothetical protein